MILTTREKIFAGLAVLLLILGIFLWRRSIYENEQMKAIALQNNTLTGQVLSYKDENGKLHGQVQTLTGDKDAYTALYQHSFDSMAKVIGIRSKNIISYNQTGIKDSGHFITNNVIPIYANRDSARGHDSTDLGHINNFGDSNLIASGYTVLYNDRWMNFKGYLINNKFTADYKITDSLTYVGYFKHTGFLGLGKRVNYLDVTATNPNVSFTSMKNIILTNEKPNRVSIGPYIGYDLFNRRLSAGVSIQYALIRF